MEHLLQKLKRWQKLENLMLNTKEDEVKLLERSVEELECTVNVLENKVHILKEGAEYQRLRREELELEFRTIRQQMQIVKMVPVNDYCSTLEGDPSYSCWKAYFELKDLEKNAPKEEVERLIIEAGGVKSLIGVLHGITEIHKAKKGLNKSENNSNSEQTIIRTCPVPDGLPKSREELEEEEKARMPDSPFTRLLRTKGRCPAWYSPAPDY